MMRLPKLYGGLIKICVVLCPTRNIASPKNGSCRVDLPISVAPGYSNTAALVPNIHTVQYNVEEEEEDIDWWEMTWSIVRELDIWACVTMKSHDYDPSRRVSRLIIAHGANSFWFRLPLDRTG